MNLLNKIIAAVTITAFSSVMAYASEEVKFDTPEQILEASKNVNIDFKEGVHYKVIEGNALSEKKEVREFFSFFCGHCHALLPTLNKITKILPEDVYFVGNPVHYLGGHMGVEFQKSYAAAVSMQMSEQFTNFFDKKIYDENKIPQSHEELVNMVTELGVPKEVFETQYKSFPIQNMANQYKQKTMDSKIQDVPTVVVNNKYTVITKNISNEAEYYALIMYLANKDYK
jgi:thiol:disulfide interchange protein DsbA